MELVNFIPFPLCVSRDLLPCLHESKRHILKLRLYGADGAKKGKERGKDSELHSVVEWTEENPPLPMVKFETSLEKLAAVMLNGGGPFYRNE